MPRFFFHILDGNRTIVDDEGLELNDVSAAVAEGKAGAMDMVRDALATGEDILDQVIEITREDGQVVERIAVRSLIRPK